MLRSGGRGGPRLKMAEGIGARAAVAGRGGDEDARIGRAEEGERGRFGPRLGAAADRIVDDIDAIGDRLIDRRHRRDVRAQALTGRGVGVAGVVRDDVGARGDAGDAQRRAFEHDVAAVAGRRGGGVTAMTVGIAEPGFFSHVGGAALVARRGADEVVTADQLAVAAPIVDLARCAGAEINAGAERIGVGVAVDRIDTRERRAAEIDARVDDAGDDAFALHRRCAARQGGGAGPCDRSTDQGRADIGIKNVLAILLDQTDTAHARDARGFGGAHVGDDAVDRMLHAATHLQRTLDHAGHLAFHLLLLALQVGHIAQRFGAAAVETRTAVCTRFPLRSGNAGSAAFIGCERSFAEEDDIGAAAGTAGGLDRNGGGTDSVARVERLHGLVALRARHQRQARRFAHGLGGLLRDAIFAVEPCGQVLIGRGTGGHGDRA